MPPTPPSEQDLDEIRRAAFELRQTDPSEAVRVLRRLAKRGGETEALVHGALGEILLEEFDDVDGALHHFGKLVSLVPDLPAGHIGLARSVARNGDVPAAQEEFTKAVAGLDRQVRDAMSAGEDAQEGLEETVLTALELMVEERDLISEMKEGTPRTQPNEQIQGWAESTRLFDSEEDLDDWTRFAHLRSMIAAIDGQRDAAMGHVDRVAALVSMPEPQRHWLRSLALEAAADIPAAASEALQSIQLAGTPSPAEKLRAASLLAATDRQIEARALAEQAQRFLQGAEAQEELPPDVCEELQEQASGLLETLAPGLVSLGLTRPKGDK